MSADVVHMARTSKYISENTAPIYSEVWNAGLYIRLSKEDGDKPESESISSQKAILERFTADRPEINLYDIYIDDGWSGTDFDRPSFRKMISDITEKRLNCVIVKDLSRFGRNYVEAGKYLETIFPLFNIRFISVNDCIDSFENPQSVNNVIVPFKNIINDEYCRDISIKVRSALDIRRRQGKFIGSFAAYGYKKDPADHNKLIVDEQAAEIVKLIFKKFLQGYSIIAITRQLNGDGCLNPSDYRKGFKSGQWVDSTVRRILSNQLYIGNLVQKKNEVISYKIHVSKKVEDSRRITVMNTHEPIISEEDFFKVQNLLKRDTRISPSSGRLSVFAGYIKCADCGRAMQKRSVGQNGKVYEYYVCSTYKKLHKCSKRAVRADVLENTVLKVLNGYIALAVDYEKALEKMNRQSLKNLKAAKLNGSLDMRKRELERAKRILTDLYPDYKEGIIGRAQYLALKEKYDNKIDCLERAIDNIYSELKIVESGATVNGFIEAFKKYRGLDKLSRAVVVELIENIFIHEDKTIEIRLKCRDEFEEIKERLSKDSAVVSTG